MDHDIFQPISHFDVFFGEIFHLDIDFSLGVEKITESYKSLNLKVKHYSGRELSEQLSAKFEKFFDEKVYALRNLTQVGCVVFISIVL